MDRVRIVFIGAGGIAQRHLGCLEQFADVDIVGFADRDMAQASGTAARYGASAHANHCELLDRAAPDAVYVCVPPFAHGAIEHDIIARRLPFFVEKPLSTDLATARSIAAKADEAGLVTAVGYHWRYLDTVQEARELLAETPAQLVCGHWLDATPPSQWWWQQSLSGGQIVEQATHLLDLARYLVGPVVAVAGFAGHGRRGAFAGLDVATASSASLRLASGAVGNLVSTCMLRWTHQVSLQLFADGLAIELTDHDIMVDRGQGRPVRRAEADPVWLQDRAFIDAVKGDASGIRCTYGDALATHCLALSVAKALKSGDLVEVPSDAREVAGV